MSLLSSTMGPSLAYGYSPFTTIARRFQNKVYTEPRAPISKNFYIKRDDGGKILGAFRDVEGAKERHHRKQHSFRAVQDASQKVRIATCGSNSTTLVYLLISKSKEYDEILDCFLPKACILFWKNLISFN